MSLQQEGSEQLLLRAKQKTYESFGANFCQFYRPKERKDRKRGCVVCESLSAVDCSCICVDFSLSGSHQTPTSQTCSVTKVRLKF